MNDSEPLPIIQLGLQTPDVTPGSVLSAIQTTVQLIRENPDCAKQLSRHLDGLLKLQLQVLRTSISNTDSQFDNILDAEAFAQR